MNKYHRQPRFASTLLAGAFVLLLLLAASSSYAAAEQQAASQNAPAMAAGITVQVNVPVDPWVNLGEIRSVGSNYQGEAAVVLNAAPLSLASADLLPLIVH